MSAELAAGLARYLRSRLPGSAEVTVDEIAQISGGASRETFRFRARYRDAAGGDVERRLILRRDPADSLIETERRNEFEAYRAFFGTSVPVPEVLWLEEDPAHLGSPFFIAVEVCGFEANPILLQSEPFIPLHRKIGERKWTILGEIARHDPKELGLDAVMKPAAPDTAWKTQLDYWEGVIDADELTPQPIIRWAIRCLRQNPPPPAQKISVVHGDFRSGNFLYDAEGTIHAVLDWEMAHLGDPLEDLGWSFNRVWCYGRDDRRGGLLPREEAIAIWERASGLRADPVALRWWELFNCVKGQGIWLSAAKAWNDGTNRDPILVYASWFPTNIQDRHALELMGEL